MNTNLRRSLLPTCIALMLAWTGGQPATGGEIVQVRFADGKWDRELWLDARSAHVPRLGTWLQRDDHIENQVPADATPAEMLSKRAKETAACLVLREPLPERFTVHCTASFDHRMAPAILLTPELHAADNGPQFQDHLQIVLYDKGINVWKGDWTGVAFEWKKVCYGRAELKPKQRYTLSVTRVGDNFTVEVADVFGFDFDLEGQSNRLQTGIIAGEGVNRFYEFRVSTPGDESVERD